MDFNAGDKIFAKGSHPNSFYVVLSGAIASDVGEARPVYRKKQILSGAGITESRGSMSNLFDASFLEKHGSTAVATLWPVCGVFGYSDLSLDRSRVFGAVAAQNGSRVARITRSQMNILNEDPALSALVHKVLLRVSLLDLQNCTCSDV